MSESSLSPTASALLSTVFVSLAPNLLLFLFPDYGDKKTVKGSMVLSMGQAIAAGGLLGDVFLHTLPHAMEADANPHGHGGGGGGGLDVGQSVMVGFCCFLVLDGVVRSLDSHDHDHGHGHGHSNGKRPDNGHGDNGHGDNGHASNGHGDNDSRSRSRSHGKLGAPVVLNLAADALHNFTDGLAIGASYASNAAPLRGALATLSVVLHEIPHELGDYSVLVSSGYSKREAIAAQFSTAAAALLGTLAGLWTPSRTSGGGGGVVDGDALLSFTSGGFVYLAACTILPELLRGEEHSGRWSRLGQLAAFLTGVAFMQAVAVVEHSVGGHDHGHHDHDHHHHHHHVHHEL